MLRLVFEAVMIIAIVSCLVFMMKVSASENKQEDRLEEDEKD